MGESGRTGFDRGWEHLNACRRQDQESPLVEHAEKEHEGAIPRFKMEIKAYPKSNLARQALEASQIQENGRQNLLNRKGEWGQNLPPNLCIEDEKEEGKVRKKRIGQVLRKPDTGGGSDPPPPAKKLKAVPTSVSIVQEVVEAPKESEISNFKVKEARSKVRKKTGTGVPEGQQGQQGIQPKKALSVKELLIRMRERKAKTRDSQFLKSQACVKSLNIVGHCNTILASCNYARTQGSEPDPGVNCQLERENSVGSSGNKPKLSLYKEVSEKVQHSKSKLIERPEVHALKIREFIEKEGLPGPNLDTQEAL